LDFPKAKANLQAGKRAIKRYGKLLRTRTARPVAVFFELVVKGGRKQLTHGRESPLPVRSPAQQICYKFATFAEGRFRGIPERQEGAAHASVNRLVTRSFFRRPVRTKKARQMPGFGQGRRCVAFMPPST
jgi:hypothetical protein